MTLLLIFHFIMQFSNRKSFNLYFVISFIIINIWMVKLSDASEFIDYPSYTNDGQQQDQYQYQQQQPSLPLAYKSYGFGNLNNDYNQYQRNTDDNNLMNTGIYSKSDRSVDSNFPQFPSNSNDNLNYPEKQQLNYSINSNNTPAPTESTLNNIIPMVSPKNNEQDSEKYQQLQKMVQQLYMAQAQVQLEATEIQRAQTIAAAAQQNLEESSNNVRIITAALHTAQEEVANAALRAQTTQLQLSAHDQLLFTARQNVDALSAQMIGLQAEVGIGNSNNDDQQNKMPIDLPKLLDKLKQPLRNEDQPQPIPTVLPPIIITSTISPAFAATATQINNNNSTKELHHKHSADWNAYPNEIISTINNDAAAIVNDDLNQQLQLTDDEIDLNNNRNNGKHSSAQQQKTSSSSSSSAINEEKLNKKNINNMISAGSLSDSDMKELFKWINNNNNINNNKADKQKKASENTNKNKRYLNNKQTKIRPRYSAEDSSTGSITDDDTEPDHFLDNIVNFNMEKFQLENNQELFDNNNLKNINNNNNDDNKRNDIQNLLSENAIELSSSSNNNIDNAAASGTSSSLSSLLLFDDDRERRRKRQRISSKSNN